MSLRHEGSPRLPFNDSSYPVVVSEEDREIGKRTNELFVEKLIRPLPWHFKDNKITVTQAFKTQAELNKVIPGIDYVPGLKKESIITDGLEKERISNELARVIARFKMVEDFLPDYMGRSYDMFRNDAGINRSYHQWGKEEMQHSLAAGLILEMTGHKTAEQIMQEYQKNLERTWEIPFPTARQMVIYATFQERNTRDVYQKLSDRAKQEGSPITASILSLVAKDEAYHAGGYTLFTKIYHDVDPEGTKQDVLHVARNYRMPAQNLFPDPRRAVVDLVKVEAYKSGMIGERVILPTLKSFGFISETLALQTVKEFGSI